MKKLIAVMIAGLALAVTSAAYAADNGTEFGIEDDLTVLGTGGNASDPDVDIAGYTIMRSSAEVYGYMTMLSTVTVTSGNLKFSGSGANGQVLTYVDGFAQWRTPATGTIGGSGTQYKLPLWTGSSTIGDSLLSQDSGATSVYADGKLSVSGDFTVSGASSATITGALSVGGNTGVTGTMTSGGLLSANGGIAVDTNKFTVEDATGNTAIAGTLGVTGETTVSTVTATGTLSVAGATTLSSTLGVTGNATVTGNSLLNGGINVNTGKFTVAGTDGATAIAGTLGVTGEITATTATATGSLTVGGATALNGGLTMDTNKFTVADGTGNTSIGGTLGVTGDATFTSTVAVGATNLKVGAGGSSGKVLMSDASGFASWQTLSGTLSGGSANWLPIWTGTNSLSSSPLYYLSNMLTVYSSMTVTGPVTMSDTVNSVGYITDNTNKFKVTAATGAFSVNTSSFTVGPTGSIMVQTTNFVVDGATGNTSVAGTMGVTGASTLTGKVGVGQSPDAQAALAVSGSTTSGEYITKFYSGASLAAWIKKK